MDIADCGGDFSWGEGICHGLDRRRMRRTESDQALTITALDGQYFTGVMCNMNGEAIMAQVQTEFEPANRVKIGYRVQGTEWDLQLEAIVTRCSGFRYVFDFQLAQEFDEALAQFCLSGPG